MTASVLTPPRRRRLRHAAACALVSSVALAGIAAAPGTGGRGAALPGIPERGARFQRLATLPAYTNSSADDVASAEIAAATPDGRTLVYRLAG